VAAADPSLSAESFLERFKDQWFKHGTSKIKSEAKIQVSGRLAYRLKDTAILAGKEVYRASTIVIDGGRFYQIDAMGMGSDPLADPAVRDCVASFQLLGQVASPVAKSSISGSVDQLAERIREITFGILLGPAVLFVVIKLVRGKRGQRGEKILIAG